MAPFPSRSDNMSNAPLPHSEKDALFFQDNILLAESTSILGKHRREGFYSFTVPTKKPKVRFSTEQILITMICMS